MNYFFTSSKEFNWSRGKWIISLGQKVLFICSIKCFTNVEWELRGSVSVRVGWAIEANIQNVKDSREEQYISLSLSVCVCVSVTSCVRDLKGCLCLSHVGRAL